MAGERRFEAVVAEGPGGRVFLPIDFYPDEIWGPKPRHHLAGTINFMSIRGVVEDFGGRLGIVLGPAWRRDCGLAPGDVVHATLWPEGPQREGLDADVAAALDAEPAAGAFFDGLAQFYRRAFLKWIDGAKRRPEVRAARVAEMVALLKAGKKQREG